MHGNSQERKRRITPVFSRRFLHNSNHNGYAENPSTLSNIQGVNSSSKHSLSPLSIFPPPPSEELFQESVDDLKEIEKTYNNIQCETAKTTNDNNYEIYNFSKGPDSAILSLFDSVVKLPGNTITNVTNDGLQIMYGDHEIMIRRVKKISDDIIEV